MLLIIRAGEYLLIQVTSGSERVSELKETLTRWIELREAWPTQKDYALHEVMLAGWGMPIGELFDLEGLADHCKKLGRYSFFVVSKPVNVPGGVASPPNMVAIF